MTPPRRDPDTAEPGEIDPHHIIALATRVENLAGEVTALRQELAELDNDVTGRLLTKEQIAEVIEILSERAGVKWFKARLRYYGWGLLALLGGIFVVRDYLSRFFTWLATVLR